MAAYTYDPGLVINDATGAPVASAVGQLRAVPGGSAVPVYDLNGTPLANLTTNAAGVVRRFSADISVGYLYFTGPEQRVASDQQQEALAAATAAQGAAAASAASSAQSAAQAATTLQTAQNTATAALTAATWERVPQNPAGTWTPKQSVVPRVFIRSIVGSDRPGPGNIVGSSLMIGDRVEHEVALP